MGQGEHSDEEVEEFFKPSMLSDRRNFGTGYFAFSGDNKERAEQMSQLNDVSITCLYVL
jgi:hypothetical protein